ncbi:Phosphoglucomutase-3 [Glugoides intestinalis]
MRNTKKLSLNKNLTKPSVLALYGTAGYRLNTADLNNVLCRASLIAYIRSATFAGKFIGLYITASHNPIDYNGMKFIDFNGNVLEESWEVASDELVNSDDNDFNTIINKIFRQNSNYSNMNDSIKGNVIIGRDTRLSGATITESIKEVLGSYRCNVFDYGIVTCPEMHFLIRKCNEKNKMVEKSMYIDNLYNNFVELKKITNNSIGFGIDTANGVAKMKIDELIAKDADFGAEVLNDAENGILNKDCGADFVKVRRVAPILKKTSHQLCASFDGDVDRLVLYTQDSKILDGDAQCVFVAEMIKKELEKEGMKAEIGVVLSHYSNMGAMNYLKSNGFLVLLTQTGVKNFVREARKYDIGIYFEPNGHGSVTFSKRFLEKVDNMEKPGILKLLTQMFDPCVGDALANFLVMKATLKTIGDLTKYKENYSRLMTVKIKDKNIIKVDQNNVVIEPDIQKKIDEQVLTFKGRSFVRPSGTEDLVRIFAECPNEKNCDGLALNVAQIVYDNCDGIGPHPEIFYNKN